MNFAVCSLKKDQVFTHPKTLNDLSLTQLILAATHFQSQTIETLKNLFFAYFSALSPRVLSLTQLKTELAIFNETLFQSPKLNQIEKNPPFLKKLSLEKFQVCENQLAFFERTKDPEHLAEFSKHLLGNTIPYQLPTTWTIALWYWDTSLEALAKLYTQLFSSSSDGLNQIQNIQKPSHNPRKWAQMLLLILDNDPQKVDYLMQKSVPIAFEYMDNYLINQKK